jgi:hypothetical protein
MATFGNTNVYNNDNAAYAGGEVQTVYATLSESGTVTSLSIRIKKTDTDHTCRLGIYDDDGGYPATY